MQLDAGFASKANIALLKELQLGYLIKFTRSSRAGFAEEFAAGGFEEVPGRDPDSPVEVRSIPDPEDPDAVLVLCRSALRREKELAMISRAEKRFLDDVAALRTDQSLGAARIWLIYMTLLQAEEGYACLLRTGGYSTFVSRLFRMRNRPWFSRNWELTGKPSSRLKNDS